MLVRGGRVHAFIEYERDGQKACFAKVNLEFTWDLCDAFQRERRGVPSDASTEVLSDYRDGVVDIVPARFWNATWLSMEEFRAHLAKNRHPAEYDVALATMEMLPNARLVLWFEPLLERLR